MANDPPVIPDWEKQAQANAAENLANGVQGGTAADRLDGMKAFSLAQKPSPIIGQLQQTRETAGKGLPAPATPPKKEGIQESTVGDVSNEYFTWDVNTRQQFLGAVRGTGKDPAKMTDSDLAALWRSYVVQSAQHVAQGRNLTPWSVMALDIFTRESERKKEIEEPGKTTTATQTQTNLSTQLDAKATLFQASKTLLGRAPTDTEVSRFWENLNAAESSNPQVTTTTNTTAGTGELINQEQTITGGMSADAKQMLVMEEAKKNPEYGAYQASTKFKDALMDMVYGKGY